MAGEDHPGPPSTGSVEDAASRKAGELPPIGGSDGLSGARTPLFYARHAERYARQQLIRDYEALGNCNFIVIIDQIFPDNLTYLEELLSDCESDRPLHVMIASPGGDGETAIRMVRSMQSRCTELVMIVPDMAKSAATLVCLGADRIIMGPGGDLGPVDPQFQLGNGRGLGSAKEIVAAIDEAESRIKDSPETFPLFASLLADINMLMVEQARSALKRTGAMVAEALAAAGRNEAQVKKLTKKLRAPLINDPASHSAVISATAAKSFGLPAESADPRSADWNLVWQLWTRYFVLGCFPVGRTAAYEGKRVSHIIAPGSPPG